MEIARLKRILHGKSWLLGLGGWLCAGLGAQALASPTWGQAVVLSRLGQPLAVVVPLKFALGEAYVESCWRAKVKVAGKEVARDQIQSLVERQSDSLNARVIVRSLQPIQDAAVQLSMGCPAQTLNLDLAAGAGAAAAAMTKNRLKALASRGSILDAPASTVRLWGSHWLNSDVQPVLLVQMAPAQALSPGLWRMDAEPASAVGGMALKPERADGGKGGKGERMLKLRWVMEPGEAVAMASRAASAAERVRQLEGGIAELARQQRDAQIELQTLMTEQLAQDAHDDTLGKAGAMLLDALGALVLGGGAWVWWRRRAKT